MKKQLKNLILSKRNSLSRDEIIKKSSGIKKNLFGLKGYKKSKTPMFFVSFGNEVFTHGMIKEALNDNLVAVPKVIRNDIMAFAISDFRELVPGKFGILEPLESIKVPNKNIDLVLVPGLAFDNSGHRIGYGLGHYDRFLKKIPKALKIGLCFDFQLVEKVPREKHDVPVDVIVTEKRIVKCRKF